MIWKDVKGSDGDLIYLLSARMDWGNLRKVPCPRRKPGTPWIQSKKQSTLSWRSYL